LSAWNSRQQLWAGIHLIISGFSFRAARGPKRAKAE
jgi:hypothetical protein